MTFKEWLLANWDNLRKGTKRYSDDDHKVLDLENDSWWIHYSHEKPLDSWDRLFVLYLIDVHPECVGKTWDEAKGTKDIEDFGNCDCRGYEGKKAYDNYERECLSDEDAWEAMVAVAKKGRDAVLADSYEDGGWFGAS